MTGSIEFPSTSIVGSCGELAYCLSENTEVPAEFVFAAALTQVGAICSGALTMDLGFTNDTRLYTVLLGSTYEVKKSTSLRKTLEFFSFFTAINPGLTMPEISYGIGSGEGLARLLSEKKKVVLAYDELRSFVEKSSIKIPRCYR
jgi:hypothetical protein